MLPFCEDLPFNWVACWPFGIVAKGMERVIGLCSVFSMPDKVYRSLRWVMSDCTDCLVALLKVVLSSKKQVSVV